MMGMWPHKMRDRTLNPGLCVSMVKAKVKNYSNAWANPGQKCVLGVLNGMTVYKGRFLLIGRGVVRFPGGWARAGPRK
jgi:hypothetical protein